MPTKKTVLIIDDDPVGRETLCEAVGEMGYRALAAPNGAAGLETLTEQHVDVVVTDLKMPDMDGLEVLRRVKELDPAIFVILITAYAAVDTAISAMKEGAYDYVTKPIDLRQINALLERTIEAQELLLTNTNLRERIEEKYGFDSIIGKSPDMQRVFELVRQVAPANTVVLIQGESGTGKELVANAIHHTSQRSHGAFIKVNCAALPETLLESELFGHEKGSFTGALKQRKGRFEAADGGTLFLDEISEMTPSTQVKLLRVLQEYELQRVGGNETIHVDVRVIAATNADLQERVAEGMFREDLFYRLNVVPMRVPALRERREDIPLLIAAFVKDCSDRNDKLITEITPRAVNLLMMRDWPGNVRELQNCIENMVVTARSDKLDVEDIPAHLQISADHAGIPVGMTMREIEEQAIRETLDSVGGNRKQAAEVLGIGLRTLHRKIEEYGIERIRKRT